MRNLRQRDLLLRHRSAGCCLEGTVQRGRRLAQNMFRRKRTADRNSGQIGRLILNRLLDRAAAFGA